MFQLKTNNNGSLIISSQNKSGNSSSYAEKKLEKTVESQSLVFLDEIATAFRFKSKKQVEKG
jgi:hypothetical protein